jgi:hypothetical protein
LILQSEEKIGQTRTGIGDSGRKKCTPLAVRVQPSGIVESVQVVGVIDSMTMSAPRPE